MRYGFTTGSCAAAAAKAAAFMLLTGGTKENIAIETPKGILFPAEICGIERGEDYVSCAVVKDGGDDPDKTTGAHIFARVSYAGNEPRGKVIIDGGPGVGRVTKPGLDQMVGKAAINSVPRQMIEKEVREVMALSDFEGSLRVIISCPEGEEIARHTFNPRLGIEGGISILGTSGVVEPMSKKALTDTIAVEIRQKKALGCEVLALSPGNYGRDFMKAAYDCDIDTFVKCSNFIGETVDMAIGAGFTKMLLVGHVGKLVKVSGGIMNTHSHEADSRLELLSAWAIRAGSDADTARRILEAVTTEEGLRLLKISGHLEEAMSLMTEKIRYYLDKRADGRLKIECLVYSEDFGLLGKTDGAENFIKMVKS